MYELSFHQTNTNNAYACTVKVSFDTQIDFEKENKRDYALNLPIHKIDIYFRVISS